MHNPATKNQPSTSAGTFWFPAALAKTPKNTDSTASTTPKENITWNPKRPFSRHQTHTCKMMISVSKLRISSKKIMGCCNSHQILNLIKYPIQIARLSQIYQWNFMGYPIPFIKFSYSMSTKELHTSRFRGCSVQCHPPCPHLAHWATAKKTR